MKDTMSETKTPIAVLPWLPFLGLLFIGLKLCGVIGWSWWLVTLPFWVGAALLLGLVVGVIVLSVVASAFAVLFLWIVRLFEKRKK